MTEKYCIGVDIGGTTVKIAITNTDGEIFEKWEIPTRLEESGANIPKDIWESIEIKATDLRIDQKQLIGIGVGAPGFVERSSGYIYQAVNIGWTNYRLGEILEELSGLPVYVENDANLAALGENWKGAGELAEDLIAVTLGTGVGGGIIANGKILNGANGMAGEIGHITVEPGGYLCNCGRRGCLETIASASGVARLAEEYCRDHPDSKSELIQLYNERQSLTAKDVFDLAEKGAEEAQAIVGRVTDVLGLAIANAATVVNPSKILIGGGVSKAGDTLLTPLRKAYADYTLPRVNEASEFVIAGLGNDAGVVGGSFLVMKNGDA